MLRVSFAVLAVVLLNTGMMLAQDRSSECQREFNTKVANGDLPPNADSAGYIQFCLKYRPPPPEPSQPVAPHMTWAYLLISLLFFAGSIAVLWSDEAREVLTRAVIFVSKVMALFLVIISTAYGAMVGASSGYLVALLMHVDPTTAQWLGIILGGMLGFSFSAFALAIILMLSQIERNTRH
jgi:hypothetical protein